MRKKIEIENIGQIFLAFGEVFFNKKIDTDTREGLFLMQGNQVVKKYGGNTWYCVNVAERLFFQPFEGEGLFVMDKDLKEKLVSPKRISFYSIRQELKNYLKIRHMDDRGNWKNAWVNISFEIREPKNHYDLEFKGVFVFKGFSKNIIKGYDELENLIWETDISRFGSAGEFQNDKLVEVPNSIDRKILGSEKNVIVPLMNGHLLALNAATGEKAWQLELPSTGFCLSYKDRLYKHDGKTIYEIDVNTGALIKEIAFEKDAIAEGFYASDWFWLNEEYIILKNIMNGDILILDRLEMKVVKLVETGTNLASSDANLIWHNAQLYLIDLDDTLHIFE